MRQINLLEHSANKYPDKIAIKDNFCDLTYNQLLSKVEQLSENLTFAGSQKGVTVAIVLPYSASYLISFFAIAATSAINLPLSSKMTIYEIFGFLKKANVSIIITEESFLNHLLVQWCKEEHISIITIEINQNSVMKINTISLCSPRIDSNNNDVTLMISTSGTTSKPKIVMLTDNQLLSNMFTYRQVMNFDQPNIVYCSLPLHHIYCISAQLLTHISLGDTLIVKSNPFFIKDFFIAVHTHKITITSFVPYMAMLMAEYPEPEQFNLSSLKYITLAGAKTPKSVYEKLIQLFDNIKFINTYGLSEASPRISIAAPEPDKFPIDSVGKAMPGINIRIIDNNGNVLPTGSEGEIEVQGSNIFKGYYNYPTLTKQTIVNGWLRTGDIGKLDTEGNLYIIGRKKEIILCGGENIYPDEIEDALLENKIIKDTAIIGIPDNMLEEVPCAFVVPQNNFCNEIDILDFCRKRLSSSKIPRKVFFVDEIPKVELPRLHV